MQSILLNGSMYYIRSTRSFCKLVVCDEPYAEKNLEDFKKPDEYPFITVTVDMLETGVDVPEITNLVFAKRYIAELSLNR